jgi:hypothetical protein
MLVMVLPPGFFIMMILYSEPEEYLNGLHGVYPYFILQILDDLEDGAEAGRFLTILHAITAARFSPSWFSEAVSETVM